MKVVRPIRVRYVFSVGISVDKLIITFYKKRMSSNSKLLTKEIKAIIKSVKVYKQINNKVTFTNTKNKKK